MLKLFRKRPVRIRVERRSETKLRLSDWQNDPLLCNTASKILANQDLQLMLSVLKNEHPMHIALSMEAPIEARAIHQARAEGYEMFLSNLERLAVNTTPVPMPEAVFEEE